jgi:type I restriction enzyme S subunit
MLETTKVQMEAIEASLPEQRYIVVYLDELQAKVDALRRLQAETGAEMDALMPAVLDRAFKGEL